MSVLKMHFCKQKIKVDLNKVYDIITIEYNHPFCKILRPESILDIPVNDNGLKKNYVP